MSIDWDYTYAALWRHHSNCLRSVYAIDPVSLEDLVGVERQKEKLLLNTRRFIEGKPANHALLWGARGTGKSSLVKAIFNAFRSQGLRLIEIDKDDLIHLPEIVDEIRELKQRFIVYCDDLSFEADETYFKSFKSVLEGSIEMPPDNVLVYATSNRRHLMPEFMQDNLNSTHVGGEVHYSDAIEEKISLSDRFGLWISFYSVTQAEYLEIVDAYFVDFNGEREQLHKAAVQFAMQKGGRSGRTARQFFNAYCDAF